MGRSGPCRPFRHRQPLRVRGRGAGGVRRDRGRSVAMSAVMEIRLSQTDPSVVTIVDADDYEWLSQWVWGAQESRSGLRARRIDRSEGRQKKIYMSRVILNAQAGEYVDHINGDTLDNRRSNLRLCSNQENLMNRGLNKNNTSGYKGVTWNAQKNKWMAQITVDHQHVYLGCFESPQDAARAYDKAASDSFGEFALTNEKMGLLDPMEVASGSDRSEE